MNIIVKKGRCKMEQIDLNKLIDLIKVYFPQDGFEISDALDLLNLALEGLLNSANNVMTELNKSKDYDKSMELLEFSKSISTLQGKINKYSNLISMNSETDEEEIEDELDEIEEQRTIPNYADYVVDSSIPHTLYESFTHKKVTAFSFDNIRYPADNWKDVLIKTCNLLAEMDADKFLELIDDPAMKGRKISYFSRKHIEGRNDKLSNIDVYVWTKLSANSIRNLIIKLLKKFNLSINDYYIYLRADYTPLHKE